MHWLRTLSWPRFGEGRRPCAGGLSSEAHVVAPWGCASLKLSIPLFRSSSFVSSLSPPPSSPQSPQSPCVFAGARDAPLYNYCLPPAPVLTLQPDRLCPRPTTLHTSTRFFVIRDCSARPSLAPCLLPTTTRLLREEKTKVSLSTCQQTVLSARATPISPSTRPSPSTKIPPFLFPRFILPHLLHFILSVASSESLPKDSTWLITKLVQ